MTDFILANEPTLRLGCFFGILAVMALWEVVAPRRALSQSKAVRWYSNLGIVVVNSLVVRLLFPMAAVGIAVLAAERGWGLLNTTVWTSIFPAWITFLLAVVILDFAIYLQHVLFHAVPALWRLHRMHHADLDFDVTTGARFHPIEIVLSMIIKMAMVAALGPSAIAVIIFEIVLNLTAMFNHANVGLPLALDRFLRLFVVTPDMHRVHHSIVRNETNSNFGFNLPGWDRLFGTYRAQPAAGHTDMIIGIEQFRDAPALHLHRMLVQPFAAPADTYPINHEDRT